MLALIFHMLLFPNKHYPHTYMMEGRIQFMVIELSNAMNSFCLQNLASAYNLRLKKIPGRHLKLASKYAESSKGQGLKWNIKVGVGISHSRLPEQIPSA